MVVLEKYAVAFDNTSVSQPEHVLSLLQHFLPVRVQCLPDAELRQNIGLVRVKRPRLINSLRPTQLPQMEVHSYQPSLQHG